VRRGGQGRGDGEPMEVGVEHMQLRNWQRNLPARWCSRTHAERTGGRKRRGEPKRKKEKGEGGLARAGWRDTKTRGREGGAGRPTRPTDRVRVRVQTNWLFVKQSMCSCYAVARRRSTSRQACMPNSCRANHVAPAAATQACLRNQPIESHP
jgi:hypothetical protein